MESVELVESVESVESVQLPRTLSLGRAVASSLILSSLSSISIAKNSRTGRRTAVRRTAVRRTAVRRYIAVTGWCCNQLFGAPASIHALILSMVQGGNWLPAGGMGA